MITHDGKANRKGRTPKYHGADSKNTNGLRNFSRNPLIYLAEWTGLEPATPGVTGRYSNQLNYHSW
jgi:hypothetical protein